ncbi:uncharacterized protein LOC131018725 [Salvia miltiorrhiza]|uniref:uncharacterized protein LOC131018725 n=1 Tax=Salvia miltiorrhiza TaxID=226208 RepID=UPI0025AD4B36|nr:uncharacterized protein LOC131018725 [Salvia miltiorrhiza]
MSPEPIVSQSLSASRRISGNEFGVEPSERRISPSDFDRSTTISVLERSRLETTKEGKEREEIPNKMKETQKCIGGSGRAVDRATFKRVRKLQRKKEKVKEKRNWENFIAHIEPSSEVGRLDVANGDLNHENHKKMSGGDRFVEGLETWNFGKEMGFTSTLSDREVVAQIVSQNEELLDPAEMGEIQSGVWKPENLRCCFVNVYAPTEPSAKIILWDMLKLVVEQNKDLCLCLLGDFNAIREPGDRVGIGEPHGAAESRAFDLFIRECQLLEIRTQRQEIHLVLAKWEMQKMIDWGPKPFRFINVWTSHPEFMNLVKKVWEETKIPGWSCFVFKEKLKRLKVVLKEWNRSTFGDIDLRIRSLKDDLHQWDSIDDTFGLEESEVIKRNETKANLILQTRKKISVLQQKAGARWVRDGDLNTSFYHRVIVGRRKKNEISGLQFGNQWIAEPMERIENGLSDCSWKMKLKRPFGIVRETRARVRMDLILFSGASWDTIKGDLFQVLKDFHSNGKNSRGCNSSFIILIPKKDEACELADFRPISLISSLYKVIAKILTGRLKKVVDSIISENQSAFVSSRYILDGVVILNEAIAEAKKQKIGRIIFKIDFAKAYDSVEWDFIDVMLDRLNFHPVWRKLIRGCLESATANVLVNGSTTGEFSLERGLRQRDPISPFLFLIAAEGLHSLIERATEKSLFVPTQIGKEKLKISHLQYADDTIFVLDADYRNVPTVKNIISFFQFLSGLAVNYSKSSLVGVGVDDNKIEGMASDLNCKVGVLPFKYLGIKVGGRPKSVVDWSHIVDKVKKKVEGWKNRKLSLAGRITLVKAVLQAIPIYQLSFSFIPKATALVLKWLWRYLEGGGLLWARVVRSIYGELAWGAEGSCNVGRGRSATGWWPNLVLKGGSGVSGWFRDNVVRKVGDGQTTKFWDHCWAGRSPLRFVFPRLYQLCANKEALVSEMGKWISGEWKCEMRWRRELRDCEVEGTNALVTFISDFTLCAGTEDCWMWTAAKDGKYTTKSAYLAIKAARSSTQSAASNNEALSMIWDTPAIHKAKVVAWRILRSRLPSCDNLKKRNVPMTVEELGCSACFQCLETIEHVFLNYPKTGGRDV